VDISSGLLTLSLSVRRIKTVHAAGPRNPVSVKMETANPTSGNVAKRMTATSWPSVKTKPVLAGTTHASLNVRLLKIVLERTSPVRISLDISASVRTACVNLRESLKSVVVNLIFVHVLKRVCVLLISPVPVPRASVQSPGG